MCKLKDCPGNERYQHRSTLYEPYFLQRKTLLCKHLCMHRALLMWVVSLNLHRKGTHMVKHLQDQGLKAQFSTPVCIKHQEGT